MKLIFTILVIWLNGAESTIDGLSYMDPLPQRPYESRRIDDPCNPLYWYPRNIPQYCYEKIELPSIPKNVSPTPPFPDTRPIIPENPIPIPIMVPQPIPLPSLPLSPVNVPQPIPFPSVTLPPVNAPVPVPFPGFPLTPVNAPVPVPFPGFPLPPVNVPMPVPFPGFPITPNFPIYARPPPLPRFGMVPGLPGLVTRDGGINIMPFSDAYADMLEKHKNKIIRRKLNKLLKRYKHYPRSRDIARLRKYKKGLS